VPLANDKKKVVIMGVLVVVIGAVGAFQFVGGGPPPAKPKKDAKASVSASGETAKAGAKGSKGDGTASTKAAKASLKEALPPELAAIVAKPMSARDPFAEASIPLKAPSPVTSTPIAANPKPTKLGTDNRLGANRLASSRTPNTRRQEPMRPLPGNLPQAMGNALGGMFEGLANGLAQGLSQGGPGRVPTGNLASGDVPTTSSGNGAPAGPTASGPQTASGSNPGVNPGRETGKIPGQTGDFAYALIGVVVGQKPVAVFQGGDGRQQLVAEGRSIDGESRVVSIRERQVVVIHRGRSIVLKLGG